VKQTGTLIENPIRRNEDGGTIVVETAKSLAEIKEGIDKAMAMVSEIAQFARKQATSVSYINDAVSAVS
jgi:methyl-accepting chemotaxis protein